MNGDVVTLSNNTIEWKSGETSTPNFISLVEDQTSNGGLITTVTNEAIVEEDGGQITRIPYNIPYVQISKSITDGLVDTIS